MYVSRLKALQRAACQLKKHFKGSSSGSNVSVEVEGPEPLNPELELEPLKGFCELTGHPSKALQGFEFQKQRTYRG